MRLLRHTSVALLLFTAACGSGDIGESRLGDIAEGASRDSTLVVLGSGPLTATGSDTLRLANGFKRQMFVSNGKTYEVIYYREAPGSVTEELSRELETPVVLLDGKHIGHGWKFYETLAAAEKLPAPPAAQPKN